MERQTEGKTEFPPFVQRIFEQGLHEGELEGLREGELKGLREVLVRLLARAGIALSEGERAHPDVRGPDHPRSVDRQRAGSEDCQRSSLLRRKSFASGSDGQALRARGCEATVRSGAR